MRARLEENSDNQNISSKSDRQKIGKIEMENRRLLLKITGLEQ